MKLIVGLGNPGPQYARTRHNVGFMVLDQLVANLGGTWKTESKLKSEIALTERDGERIILAKPQTMMNLSCEAIQRLVQAYKLKPSDVWVIFDDVDVPFGRLRIRHGGSSSGHQGINSTIRHIGDQFLRFRVGISLNNRDVEPSEIYVLKPFNPDEQVQLPQLIRAAAEAITELLTQASPEEATFNLV